MTDAEVFKMLGQSGIAVGALWILARVVAKIGERMIAAIDRVGIKIDAHTTADTAAIGSLRQDVAVLDGRMQQFRDDWADQLTPVTRARYDGDRVRDEPWRPGHERDRGLPLAEPLVEPRPSTGEYSIRPPSQRDIRSKRPR